MEVKNLRILFVHSGADLYGASRSLLRLSSRLAKDGALIKVILPYHGPLADALRICDVDVVIQPDLAVLERERAKNLLGILQLLFKLIASVFQLKREIKQFKPQLIHTVTSVILSSGIAAKWTGTPHILHVRESFGEFTFFWRYYEHYLAWFSSAIVCVSTPIAKQFSHVTQEKLVSVIHNGFPAEEFEGVNAQRINAFKRSFSLETADTLVGVVGRIKFRRKGQEVFVEAAHYLRDHFPGTRFLCIGSPFPGNESHLDRLNTLIQRFGLDKYVLYMGDVDDIKAAIAALDILVLPSIQPEPFGGVVIEAMALARPVVATRIGGSIEQVRDGITGYLVEPGNATELAESIEKLLLDSNLRKEFGSRGRQRFLDKFEFESFYKKITMLYDKVLH